MKFFIACPCSLRHFLLLVSRPFSAPPCLPSLSATILPPNPTRRRPSSRASAAQRQSHLLPLHRRERPDHHQSPARPRPSWPQRPSPPTPSARPSPSSPSTWTSICTPPTQHIAVRALLTVRNDGKRPSPTSRCKSPPRSTGSAFACSAATPPFPSPRSTPTPTTPASCTKPPSRSPSRSLPARASSSTSPTPAPSRNPPSACSPSAPRSDVALHSDWDEISVPFTGLRGFGNVVWYPVSSVPVILGDGARLFDEMGEHKLRLAGAHFRLRLTVEFPHGQAPTVALINGHPAPLTVTTVDSLGQEIAGVATADARQLGPRL